MCGLLRAHHDFPPRRPHVLTSCAQGWLLCPPGSSAWACCQHTLGDTLGGLTWWEVHGRDLLPVIKRRVWGGLREGAPRDTPVA